MVRTDLAYEAHENLNKKCNGIVLNREKLSMGELISIEIKNKDAENKIGKKIGKYISCEISDIKNITNEEKKYIVYLMANRLKELMNVKKEKVLVVGLGNRKITADSLGPRTIDKIKVTRQFFKAYKKTDDEDYNELAVLTPGVMGSTGIETQSAVKGIIEKINPTIIIIVDALASREMKRLCSVIQLTDTGIEPGSGIGNMQGSLNQATLGVKVAAIGVPTVVDTATIVNDSIDLMKEKLNHKISVSGEVLGLMAELEYDEKMSFIKEVLNPKFNDTFVTPNDIDELVEILSDIISETINVAMHPGYQYGEKEI